jgi:hypothetical protein
MKYIELKSVILEQLPELNAEDFYLLEGKLVFKSKDNSVKVKKLLEGLYSLEVIMTATTNHPHWDNKYEAELYFKNINYTRENYHV